MRLTKALKAVFNVKISKTKSKQKYKNIAIHNTHNRYKELETSECERIET